MESGGFTPDTALRLERLFGMEAQFRLNLQHSGYLFETSHSPAVIRWTLGTELSGGLNPAGLPATGHKEVGYIAGI